VIDLFVDPEARRRGVGRGLIVAVSAAARAEGSAALIWTVYQPNRLAFVFYEGIGAETVRDLAMMRLRL
jgi:GNAT superfamily N-acetyltransferase